MTRIGLVDNFTDSNCLMTYVHMLPILLEQLCHRMPSEATLLFDDVLIRLSLFDALNSQIFVQDEEFLLDFAVVSIVVSIFIVLLESHQSVRQLKDLCFDDSLRYLIVKAKFDDLVSITYSLSVKDFVLITADLVSSDHIGCLDLDFELACVK